MGDLKIRIGHEVDEVLHWQRHYDFISTHGDLDRLFLGDPEVLSLDDDVEHKRRCLGSLEDSIGFLIVVYDIQGVCGLVKVPQEVAFILTHHQAGAFVLFTQQDPKRNQSMKGIVL